VKERGREEIGCVRCPLSLEKPSLADALLFLPFREERKEKKGGRERDSTASFSRISGKKKK